MVRKLWIYFENIVKRIFEGSVVGVKERKDSKIKQNFWLEHLDLERWSYRLRYGYRQLGGYQKFSLKYL